MKSIIVLLLLLLFFVSGMLFGVERERTDVPLPEGEIINEDYAVEQVAVTPVNTEYQEAPAHFTQKMASFIEGIVKVFYEIVVQLLYQIVQLFY
ncbi:hypothetical protein VBD025_10385 [Virgibacillus flavescens]|uniref:hypothetical protein n=1 Tax=Virgibacillus flavescens TaxID=1611422 RepID=UPI003D32B9A4